MSQRTLLFIVFDLVSMFSLLTGIFVAALILLIAVRKLPRGHVIANFLLANTCICTLELCISNLIVYGYIFAHDANLSTSFASLFEQQILCPIRSYFLFTGFALLYTSFCLQAYYRLRQVIYYKKHSHLSTFVYLCLGQWVLSFLLVAPMLLTKSFVYLPAEFFCPIPFFKPLAVLYIAFCVYGIFLTIFASIYYRIYTYATQITSISLQRRRTIDRQLTMLKRMILPTCSLLFLGIVYLAQFFQTVVNQYRTHFLTYRLGYLFVALGLGTMHVITILQTPSLKRIGLQLFCSVIIQLRSRGETLNDGKNKAHSTTQEFDRNNADIAKVTKTSPLISVTCTERRDICRRID